MRDAWTAAGLLLLSNAFMTTAWYGHLRYPRLPMAAAIFASWGIALFEYVLQVPANRIGHHSLSAYQLKIMQEAITLVVSSHSRGSRSESDSRRGTRCHFC